MKTNDRRLPGVLLFAAASFFASATAHGQSITDNFTGTSLNTSNWVVSLFDGTSSVAVNNGLTLTNRARLATAFDFTGSPVTITGSVRFSQWNDNFWIALRNDGTYGGPYGETGNGVALQFGTGGNILVIQGQTEGYYSPDFDVSQRVSHGFSVGQTYNFKVVDDGATISVFIDDFSAPLLTTTTSIRNGNRVAFFNREVGGSVFIGSLSVTAPTFAFQDIVRPPDTSLNGISGNLVVGTTGGTPFLYDLSTQSSSSLPGVPGANVTVPNGIDGNDVVGYYLNNWPSGPNRGYIYNLITGTWTFIDLPNPSSGTSVLGKSGNYAVGNFDSHGFVYNISTGTYTLLDVPGASGTGANAVSGDTVVGLYNAGGATHGYVYSISAGTYATLDYPGAHRTVANGVDGNNIVGNFSDAAGDHGFLYDGSGFHSIDRPSSSSTAATGISNGNIVVNYYLNGNLIGCITSTASRTLPVGANVDAIISGVGMTFSSVSTAGVTSVTPLDPAAEANFSLSNNLGAYEISSAATFSGQITLSFPVSGVDDEATFDGLTVIHVVNGVAEDPPITRDFANRKISVVVTSLSPFAVVKGPTAQIDDLITLVNSFKLQKGIQTSFTAKLQSARSALTKTKFPDKTAASNTINAFINDVQAQAGKAVSQSQSARLIAAAKEIRLVLGAR